MANTELVLALAPIDSALDHPYSRKSVQDRAAPAAILGVTDLDAAAILGAGVAIRRKFAGTKAYVQAGAAFVVDALLTTNASGQWITATTGQKAHARADAPAAAATDLVPAVFLDGDLSAP